MKQELQQIALSIARHGEKHGGSQRTIAFACEMTPQHLSLIELGKREPGILTCMKLARYYGCSLDELVGFKVDLKTPDQVKPKHEGTCWRNSHADCGC